MFMGNGTIPSNRLIPAFGTVPMKAHYGRFMWPWSVMLLGFLVTGIINLCPREVFVPAYSRLVLPTKMMHQIRGYR